MKHDQHYRFKTFTIIIFLCIESIIICLFIIPLLYHPLSAHNPVRIKHSNSALKSSIVRIPTLTPDPTITPVPTIFIPTIPLGFCVNVPVLYYHHIEPLTNAVTAGEKNLTVDSTYFESDLQYLNAHDYTSISAENLVTAILNHTSLPVKSIVLTLDDGYADNYTYAYPLAKKYNIILNLMIPTGLMDNFGYLTWGQLSEMVNSHLIFAHNHTWSHSALANDSIDKIRMEITTAEKQLNDHLGNVYPILTYPNGSYNNNVLAVLNENGFKAAFSTIPGSLQCESFIMALHRTRIGNAPLSAYGL
jgi:peptidoglycan/xylan/chitin deacetylase (PgdA/CDA1 family)